MLMTTWWHPGRTISFESGAPIQSVTSGIIAVCHETPRSVSVSVHEKAFAVALHRGVSPEFVVFTTLVTAFGHMASMRTVGGQWELFRW